MAELISGMFNTSLYKRSQGRIARQITFGAIVLAFAAAAWQTSEVAQSDMGKYVAPIVILAIGGWIGFRVVNLPKFADFLISVEAEMNKVSWPTRSEVWRGSMVVIVVIFFLAAILLVYDILLEELLKRLLGL